MKLDHASSKPLHVQAEEILRKLIESEELSKNFNSQFHFLANSTKLLKGKYLPERAC